MRKVKTKNDIEQINCTKLEYLVLSVNISSVFSVADADSASAQP
jgi:hypothetical protein